MIDKKIPKAKDRLFYERFNYYYEQRWHSKKKLDKDFKEAVAKAYMERTGEKTCSLNQNSITNWKQGQYPEKYIEDIAKVLDIEVSLFSEVGDPEYDDALRNELDRERFEYADQIGLDRNFMLFVLKNITSWDFTEISDYHYLKLPSGEKEFEKYGRVSLSEETAKDLQCKYHTLPPMFKTKDPDQLYSIPSKKELLYMLMLQKKMIKIINLEVSELDALVRDNPSPEALAKMDKLMDWLEVAKTEQRKANAKRDPEHKPKLKLWECVNPEIAFGLLPPDASNYYRSEDYIRNQIIARGEDPDQIN